MKAKNVGTQKETWFIKGETGYKAYYPNLPMTHALQFSFWGQLPPDAIEVELTPTQSLVLNALLKSEAKKALIKRINNVTYYPVSIGDKQKDLEGYWSYRKAIHALQEVPLNFQTWKSERPTIIPPDLNETSQEWFERMLVTHPELATRNTAEWRTKQHPLHFIHEVQETQSGVVFHGGAGGDLDTSIDMDIVF